MGFLPLGQKTEYVSEYDPAEIVVKELGRAATIVRSLDLSEVAEDQGVREIAEELAQAIGEMLNTLDSPAP